MGVQTVFGLFDFRFKTGGHDEYSPLGGMAESGGLELILDRSKSKGELPLIQSQSPAQPESEWGNSSCVRRLGRICIFSLVFPKIARKTCVFTRRLRKLRALRVRAIFANPWEGIGMAKPGLTIFPVRHILPSRRRPDSAGRRVNRGSEDAANEPAHAARL
ncbi:MAG TPA: hypothetical protein VL860_03250 [Planctomycetota bacterium]|nr:hypothetical protein [Planctomycetota bacterium]